MRKLALALLAGVFSVPAQADWLKMETDHFVGYSDGSEASLRDDMTRLERYDALLRAGLKASGESSEAKLTVFFMRGVQGVRRAYGGEGASKVAGFYETTSGGAVAVIPRSGAGGNIPEELNLSGDVILFHEYAHHLMYQQFTAAYPAWYSEGFAEFFATSKFNKDGSVILGTPANHRALGLAFSTPHSIEKLLTSSVSDMKTAEQGDIFYGQSWALVHMLTFSAERKGQLDTYLRLVGEGKPLIEAAQQAFGDLKAFGKEAAAYRSGRSFKAVSVKPAMPAIKMAKVTPLSEGESEAIPYRLSMMLGVKPDKADAQVQAMRKIAASHPQDAAVQSLLAEAERDAKHWPEAIAAADRAIKLDPADSRAMLWKGEAMVQQLKEAKVTDAAKWKEARGWIAKANRLNPEAATPLYFYYQSFLKEGREPPEIAVTGLRKALSLVPQEESMRITYAMALGKQKKWDEAIGVVRVIANAPHANPAADFARDISARFEAAKAGRAYVEPALPDFAWQISKADGAPRAK